MLDLSKGHKEDQDRFVCVEALRPSQQFFSHVGTEPSLPGYYQYILGVKCLAKGHNTA